MGYFKDHSNPNIKSVKEILPPNLSSVEIEKEILKFNKEK
jgi:hypothetical protein